MNHFLENTIIIVSDVLVFNMIVFADNSEKKIPLGIGDDFER